MESSSSVNKLRTMMASTSEELRRHVLRGHFSCLKTPSAWKTPSFKLLVFVSSTFTDTQLERDYLMDTLQFELRSVANVHEIQVILVDMRWGVRDENSCDHKTWEGCADMLHWCKEESQGLAFLSLQADKYGYTPLPRTIVQEELDRHLSVTECCEEVKDLIFQWYVLDENAIPREYVLKSLEHKDDKAYWSVFPRILAALEGLAYDPRHPSLQAGRSVTACEVQAAFDSYPVELPDKEKSFLWSHRLLQGEVNDRFFQDYKTNPVLENHFTELIQFMVQQFPESSVLSYDPITLGDLVAAESDNNDVQLVYRQKFEAIMREKLLQSLETVIELKAQWRNDGCGTGLLGSSLSEMLQHSEWAYEKCSTFFGRELLIKNALEIINAPHRDHYFDGTFSGVSLCVIGASGAGKTALMAKLCNEVVLQCSERNVIIRFCGTSPGSVNARSLMVSICEQIEYLMGLDRKIRSIQHDLYSEVIKYFHSLLRTHPLVLFIDSLDQLSDEDFGRSQISFLKDLKLHNDSRVIVSSLPDDSEVNPDTGQQYLYLCETRLKEWSVPRVSVTSATEVMEQSSVEALSIVDQLLTFRNRTLTAPQRDVIAEAVSDQVEVNALYLTLIVLVASQWTSQLSSSETLLAKQVRPLIGQLFDSLEHEFGDVLVQAAMGFITFSAKGVSDVEMEDLMSLHDGVLDFVFQYATPSIRRIPSHVWLRLRRRLVAMLLVVEREGGGLVWFHRQLREVAELRLKSWEKRVHLIMGDYFGNLISSDTQEQRKITLQGWTLQGSPYEELAEVNKRRCEEASHHFLSAKLYSKLEAELCNLEGICCKLRCGESFQLILELDALESAYAIGFSNGDGSDDKQLSFQRVSHFLRWLKQDVYMLKKSPIKILLSSASLQPEASILRQEALALIESQPTIPFGRPMGRPVANFDALLSTLEGHSRGAVHGVCYSEDGLRIASSSADGTIRLWDALNGSQLSVLEGSSSGMTCVCFSSDDCYVAAGGHNIVKMWNVKTSMLVTEFEDHHYVAAICFSPCTPLIATGTVDGIVSVWCARTGKLVSTMEGHERDILAVSFSSDASCVISGSMDRTIRTWETMSGLPIRSFECNGCAISKIITNACFSRNGDRVASTSKDHILRVWDTCTGEQLLTLTGHTDTISAVTFSKDGLRIASSGNMSIRIWDAVTGDSISSFEGLSQGIYSLDYSPDGSKVVSGSWDTVVRVWDAKAVIKEDDAALDTHTDGVKAVCISPDGTLIVSGSNDDNMRMWDVATGGLVRVFEDESSRVEYVCFSPTGTDVASVGNNTVRLWSVATGQCTFAMNGHVRVTIYCVRFSPDGSQLASCAADKTVKFWDTNTGELVSTCKDKSEVMSLDYSPDGGQIVLATYLGTRIIDTETKDEILIMKGHSHKVNTVSYSPDGCFIAFGTEYSPHSVHVGDPKTGDSRWVSEDLGKVLSVCFNPSSSQVAAGFEDGSVHVWNSITGACLAFVEGHMLAVPSICFSPDGSKIVTGCLDRQVRVWDVSRIIY